MFQNGVYMICKIRLSFFNVCLFSSYPVYICGAVTCAVTIDKQAEYRGFECLVYGPLSVCVNRHLWLFVPSCLFIAPFCLIYGMCLCCLPGSPPFSTLLTPWLYPQHYKVHPRPCLSDLWSRPFCFHTRRKGLLCRHNKASACRQNRPMYRGRLVLFSTGELAEHLSFCCVLHFFWCNVS